jgi:c-di-GMP-binding flagellar brake protein YcgR
MTEKPSIEGLVSSLLDSTPAAKGKAKTSSANKKGTVEERRRFPRYLVKWRAAIAHSANGEQRILHGTTKDISLGGASIFIPQNIFIEGRFTVYLQVPISSHKPGSRVMEIKGRMVQTVYDGSSHQFRCGIEFMEFVNKADRGFLEARLANHHFPLS